MPGRNLRVGGVERLELPVELAADVRRAAAWRCLPVGEYLAAVVRVGIAVDVVAVDQGRPGLVSKYARRGRERW